MEGSLGTRRQPAQRRPSGLGPAQWWSVVAVLCLIAVYFAIATIPTWYTEYRIASDGPILQRCFGFAAAEVPAPPDAPVERVFAITSVNPDGALAKAGVRAGDVPVGYQHGFASGFYQDLGIALEGGDVTLLVIAMADLGKSTSARRSIHFRNLDLKCN
jgi:hypothetical protein